MKKYTNIDEYIQNYPKDVQQLLKQMRGTIRKAAPKATEAISYGIPTFKLNGNLVHFGAFKHHIGFFPTSSGTKAFKKELSKFNHSKGTVQFPFDKPLPLGLVTKIVKFRVKENTAKAPASEFPKLSAPALRAFTSAKIKTLKDLSKCSEKDLLALHGVGPSVMSPLRAALRAKGLTFKK